MVVEHCNVVGISKNMLYRLVSCVLMYSFRRNITSKFLSLSLFQSNSNPSEYQATMNMDNGTYIGQNTERFRR